MHRALPQPREVGPCVCSAQDGDPKKGYRGTKTNSPSSAEPPLAPGPRLSPSTSVEKHLPGPQVSGAGKGGSTAFPFLSTGKMRSQRRDHRVLNTEIDGDIKQVLGLVIPSLYMEIKCKGENWHSSVPGDSEEGTETAENSLKWARLLVCISTAHNARREEATLQTISVWELMK